MGLSRRSFLPLCAIPALPQDTPRFTVSVQYVNVAFSVRDRSGRLVGNLEKQDFEVFENGKREEIRHFSREQETPLTLALILDRSPSQEDFEQENIFAAVTFFRRVLRAEDKAFAVAFGNRIKLVCDMTSSLGEIESSLKQMRDNYNRAPRVGPNEDRSGGSAVLDAVYWSAKEKLAGLGGRNAIIMIGDGKENSSRRTLVDAVDVLQAEDILFYGIDNGGSDSTQNRRLRNQMPVLAEETGGRVFKLPQTPLKQAFEEIERELRTLYTLAYSSSNPARDASYRRIEIRPKDPNLQVRARPGYYAR